MKKFFIVIVALIFSLHINAQSFDTPEEGVVKFVDRFYETVLNRKPDEHGLRDWSCQLLTYQKAGDGIARGFIFSPEFTMQNLDNYDFLVVLYRAFFDREPDIGGLNYWLDKMYNEGYSRAEVLDGFLYSQEFANLCNRFGIYPVEEYLPYYTLDRCPDIDSYVYEILYEDGDNNGDLDNGDSNDNGDINNIPNSVKRSSLGYDYTSFWRQVIADLDNGTYSDDYYLYDDYPDTSSCYEGSLSIDAKDRALLITNRVRALHQLAPVAYNYDYDYSVQKGALILASNNTITHSADESYKCYSDIGNEALSTSNIFSGFSSIDPASHIIGWVNDSMNISSVSAVGHRRWILNPFQKYISYGQVYGYGVLKVFGFDDDSYNYPSVDFVAFPYKRYPYIFIDDNTPWSFTVIDDKSFIYYNDYNYFDNAIVTVRDKITGEYLNVSNIYYDYVGFGVPNILTWRVDGIEYDRVYEVTISNVEMQDGTWQDFSYDVYIDYNSLQ